PTDRRSRHVVKRSDRDSPRSWRSRSTGSRSRPPARRAWGSPATGSGASPSRWWREPPGALVRSSDEVITGRRAVAEAIGAGRVVEVLVAPGARRNQGL